ncbi:MAG: hypothetical protein K8R79_10305 [Calditrichales bacterium]|nr:hypothetical protein [Calditrichales bacterium]
MLKRYGFIFGILLLFIYNVFADQGGSDSFGYMWTDTEGTTNIDYEWIDIKHTTRLIGPTVGDQVEGVSLPFDFEFYGHKCDSLYICANGWVSFKYPGSSGWPTNDTIPSGSGPDSMIALFWDNLASTAGNGGGVYSKTVGSAPNRNFIVQWDLLNGAIMPNKIDFELILFEHSNLIKLQYNNIDAAYSGGGSATIGIKADTSTGIQYSHNQNGAVSSSSAILFHNKSVGDTALASISPASAQAGDFPTLNYYIYDIDTSGTSGLGKLDRFAIGNPFTSSPTVTNIKINNHNAYIQNSSDKPTEAGYATWQYDAVNDSLIIQTSIFDVIDSVKVTFMQTMPETVSEGNEYKSSYDAVLDSSGRQPATDDGWSVDVVGSDVVAYYVFNPSTEQAMAAGDSITFEIKAMDEYGNAVINSDSVIFSASGSAGAFFIPNGRMAFDNDSTLNITVSDTIVGSFTVKAVKKDASGVTGQSGLITINPADGHHFVIISSVDSITVSTDRLLQAALEDCFSNRLTDSLIHSPASTATVILVN